MARDLKDDRAISVARVRYRGQPIGSGIFLAPERVLTCLHVIGYPWRERDLQVRLFDSDDLASAIVAIEALSVDESALSSIDQIPDLQDMALLQLARPILEVRPPTWGRPLGVHHKVRYSGYPNDGTRCDRVSSTVTGYDPQRGVWELRDDVAAGFSGGPAEVLDRGTWHLAGMIVSRRNRAPARTCIIPAEVLQRQLAAHATRASTDRDQPSMVDGGPSAAPAISAGPGIAQPTFDHPHGEEVETLFHDRFTSEAGNAIYELLAPPHSRTRQVLQDLASLYRGRGPVVELDCGGPMPDLDAFWPEVRHSLQRQSFRFMRDEASAVAVHEVLRPHRQRPPLYLLHGLDSFLWGEPNIAVYETMRDIMGSLRSHTESLGAIVVVTGTYRMRHYLSTSLRPWSVPPMRPVYLRGSTWPHWAGRTIARSPVASILTDQHLALVAQRPEALRDACHAVSTGTRREAAWRDSLDQSHRTEGREIWLRSPRRFRRVLEAVAAGHWADQRDEEGLRELRKLGILRDDDAPMAPGWRRAWPPKNWD